MRNSTSAKGKAGPPTSLCKSQHLSMMLSVVLLSLLPLCVGAAVKRANPTIQLVNRCSNAVQPYIAGINPSGLPSPDVLQPGEVKLNWFLCS
jgi:hypothetical protein